MTTSIILGLDVGSVRIGAALARSDVRIAQPLTVLQNGPEIFQAIRSLIAEQQVTDIVVGWPRGLEGQETAQTKSTEAFVDALRQQVSQPVYLQDEALTSHKAETELRDRKKPFAKGEVDALAATYILEDYINALERPASV
jgi:putative Holliday junction resolvase